MARPFPPSVLARADEVIEWVTECPLLAQSRHVPGQMSAFAVAIGGKADVPFCTAYVR
jgi:hypothetical protein